MVKGQNASQLGPSPCNLLAQGNPVLGVKGTKGERVNASERREKEQEAAKWFLVSPAVLEKLIDLHRKGKFNSQLSLSTKLVRKCKCNFTPLVLGKWCALSLLFFLLVYSEMKLLHTLSIPFSSSSSSLSFH